MAKANIKQIEIKTFKQEGETMVAVYALKEIKSLTEFIEDSETAANDARNNTKEEIVGLLNDFMTDIRKQKIYKSNEGKIMGQVELLNTLMEMLK